LGGDGKERAAGRWGTERDGNAAQGGKVTRKGPLQGANPGLKCVPRATVKKILVTISGIANERNVGKNARWARGLHRLFPVMSGWGERQVELLGNKPGIPKLVADRLPALWA